MTSYRTGISPHRRAATRFVARVHRTLQKAYEARRAEGVTQTSIAQAIGVHRSVVSRQLNGREDMSLGRVGEYAWVLGCDINFDFLPKTAPGATNQPAPIVPAAVHVGQPSRMTVNASLPMAFSSGSSIVKVRQLDHAGA
ncbi:helix-turn-helix domain-containing protein [Sphingobium sp. YR657]|uniref:helix-turn-helix domain-containing protein n=1 Tax=Sphingobium sp. YR657 TaxID=1884366 RepID=UPI001587632C|nr:helix-turn-helix transcriptional regulator [Sphingobium sp. YR657]